LHYASRPPDAPDEHDAYTSDDSTGRCFTARLAWTHFLEKLDDTLKSLAPADRTRLMILSKDHAPFGLTAAEASSQISASRLAIPVNDATLPPTTLVAVRGGHPPTVSSTPPPPYVSDDNLNARILHLLSNDSYTLVAHFEPWTIMRRVCTKAFASYNSTLPTDTPAAVHWDAWYDSDGQVRC
jgi:hypothetical protein